MIANSELNNENIGAVPNIDTVSGETFVDDKPEPINPDTNKEASPKLDHEKDESPNNIGGDSKEDQNSNVSDTTGGKDIDENYFSVGHFLKEDGTTEEVRLHVSEMALDSESEDEDFDDMNHKYHFAEDGSIQELNLRKKSPKKPPEVSKVRTYSLGNFLKSDGTLEEVTIPFDELESDSENGSEEEDSLEGINTTYNLGMDGCLQILLEDKNKSNDSSACPTCHRQMKDDSSDDENALYGNDVPNLKNIFNDKINKKYNARTVNEKIVNNNKMQSSNKNPFYDNDELYNKNTSDDKNKFDGQKNPFEINDEPNEKNTSDDKKKIDGKKNPFDDNDERNEKNTNDDKNPFDDNDEPNKKNTYNDNNPSDGKNPFDDNDEPNEKNTTDDKNPFEDKDEPIDNNTFENKDGFDDKNTNSNGK